MSLAARLFLSAALFFAAVFALGFAVTAGHFRGFDLALAQALAMRAGETPDWLIATMYGISWIGGGVQRYIIVGLLTLALWRWWGGGAALAMGLSTLLSAFTSEAIKAFFDRARPDLVPHLTMKPAPPFPAVMPTTQRSSTSCSSCWCRRPGIPDGSLRRQR